MRTASVVPFINVNTSIQDMLTTQPSSTISTYLRPIKTRLRRLRKRPKHVLRLRSLAQCQALSSKPDIIGSRPLGVGDAGHICGRSRPHLWAMNTQPTRQLPTLRSWQQTRLHWKPATLSGRRRPHLWAKPATLVGDENATSATAGGPDRPRQWAKPAKDKAPANQLEHQ